MIRDKLKAKLCVDSGILLASLGLKNEQNIIQLRKGDLQ